MTFAAAKPVPCIKCHATINKGEPISWTRGKGGPGVFHFACSADTPAAVTFATGYTPEAAAHAGEKSGILGRALGIAPNGRDNGGHPMPKPKHTPGPGLKILSRAKWYGGGYCAICGTRGAELIPQQVRLWDPDDGWKVGVLCGYCGEEAATRGPRPGDYAYRGAQEQADHISLAALLGDEDSTYTNHGQP